MVTLDGCESEVHSDSIVVFPQGVSDCCVDPVAYAGEDQTLCGLATVLDASLGGGGNHGQWIYVSGPSVTFVNNDEGTADIGGNPQAQIAVANAGDLVLEWREWNGSCNTSDQVTITFIEQPNINFTEEFYNVCGLTAVAEAISNVNPGTDFQWINPYTDILHSDTIDTEDPIEPDSIIHYQHVTFNDLTVFNPVIEVLAPPYNETDPLITEPLYGNYTFHCIGTVGGICKDTSTVKITYTKPPACYAGMDKSVCGTVDTLHAVTTYGGYWSVGSYPAGGTACSAVFLNQETGEPDIYDPNAILIVTCQGAYEIVWTEVNGICENSCSVTIDFASGEENIATIPINRDCSDTTKVAVDIGGHENDTWFWAVDPNWPYDVDIIFNAYDPYPDIIRDFPDEVFGDSAHVDIPFIVTLITGDGCASTERSVATFYQRPKPYIGRDTMVCSNTIDLSVINTIPTAYSIPKWYDNADGLAYDAIPTDEYATTINANLGDSLFIVFSEENILGQNGDQCKIYDTILIEFLKRPIADAGDYEANVCGNCLQLDASLDNSVNSVGRWIINSEGFYGFSCGDNDPTAVADTNAWFYHATDINPGVDTIYVKWREFNVKSAQCYDEDSVPVNFWYKDTAYIKLNGTITDIDSTCGRAYVNISGNDTLPTNVHANQYWITTDGSPVEWFYDGDGFAVNEPQLDSIRVFSIGQSAHVWTEIQFITENGDINGSEPAVCVDTSSAVRIRFDNPVIAEISESDTYPLEPHVVCGDRTCLTAIDLFDWTHTHWITNDYTYYRDDYTGDQADTLANPCLIAPGNIYPDADLITDLGNDMYNTLYLKAHNGMCIDYDTINVRWAPIPSGEFNIEQPNCYGYQAELSVVRDAASGFNKHITEIEWIFEEDDEPTSIEEVNATLDTILVWYSNSADNEDFDHAVGVRTTNIWGCTYTYFPPDTIHEPFPSYIERLDEEHPTCGECDGLLVYRNYSEDKSYSVVWANNEEFSNPTDDILVPGDTLDIEELCNNTYYMAVAYQSENGAGNCVDTIVYDLHADSTTIASSSYEFLVDKTTLQAPFEFNVNSVNNTSQNANKFTWQVFNGTQEDIALMVWEGNNEIPEYIFSNSGDYLIKLQAFNDKAPNCPATPYSDTIFVAYESILEVPNIFTPNGDLNNDEFRVKARELKDYKCVVYNRWGQKVFESDDPAVAWNGLKDNDGSELSSGSYFYVITGTGKKGEPFEFKGAVQLLREKN
jgi:gliding motility-associated-like protein